MHQVYSLTEAKAKLSEIINRVHFKNEKFTITKKGKAVAVLVPVADGIGTGPGEGLIRAKGALGQIDASLSEMVADIYTARIQETDRKVDL